MADTGLADPPDPGQLRQFPAARGAATTLHRLSEHPTPWWFSTLHSSDDHHGGRFDLTTPDGTCYTAEMLGGALIEKLLRARVKVVPAERLGELFHTTITVRRQPPTADLTAERATRFGLNSEIHSTLDYRRTRGWATALRHAGWRALRHRLRGDPAARSSGRALFGAAGLHRRAPAGMRARVAPLDRDHAERLLAERGVEVRPIPADVPLATPEV